MIYLDNDSTYSQRVFIPRDEPASASVTGHTIVLQKKDYKITKNGTTRIHPDAGYDGISAGTIGVYVSAATGVTFEDINIEENGLYVPTGDSVYTGVTVNVDQVGPYNSGVTVGYQSGYTEGIGYQKSLLSSVTLTNTGTTIYANGVSAVTVDVEPAHLTSGLFRYNVNNMTPPAGYNGWSSVTVNVPVNNQRKQMTLTTADTQVAYEHGLIVMPDIEYSGLIELTVNSDYTVSSGETLGSITENGDYTIGSGHSGLSEDTLYKELTLTVNVDQVGPYNSGYTQGYKDGSGDVEDEYLSIVVISAGSITFDFENYPIEMSVNGGEFTPFSADTVEVQAGDVIRLRGTNTTYGNSSHIYTNVEYSARWIVRGNSMSLFYGDNFSAQTAFPTTSTTMGYFFSSPTGPNFGLESSKLLKLPALVLNEGCYQYMFYRCGWMEDTPELPATELAPYAYSHMFEGSHVKTMPLLLATEMKEGCYSFMFSSTLLTSTTPLPATLLAPSCYEGMFNSCNLMEVTSTLPAVDIPYRAYAGMYYVCTNLKSAPAFPKMYSVDEGACSGMFRGCRNLTGMTGGFSAVTTSVSAFENMFTDCMSLVSVPSTLYINTIGDNACRYMFGGCTALTTGASIMAETIDGGGCQSMYEDCKSLNYVSFIHTNTMGMEAFQSMFAQTNFATHTPTLPDAPLAEGCYRLMFSQCYSTPMIPPALTATTLAPYCYESMFEGTEIDGAGITLPATTLATGCYKRMFAGSGGLIITAATLSAPVLVQECYQEMFEGCSALENITCLAVNMSATDCTKDWVKGVASSGTFTKAQSAVWTTGNDGIPNNWTVIDAA